VATDADAVVAVRQLAVRGYAWRALHKRFLFDALAYA
jgi:hypothetical protein